MVGQPCGFRAYVLSLLVADKEGSFSKAEVKYMEAALDAGLEIRRPPCRRRRARLVPRGRAVTAKWREAGTFVAYPDDRAPAILGSRAHTALGLDIAAWSESSRYLLDGRLPVERVRSIRGWTRDRQQSLLDPGFWLLEVDVVVLVGFLDFNRSREAVEAIRSAMRPRPRRRRRHVTASPPASSRGRTRRDRRHIDEASTPCRWVVISAPPRSTRPALCWHHHRKVTATTHERTTSSRTLL